MWFLTGIAVLLLLIFVPLSLAVWARGYRGHCWIPAVGVLCFGLVLVVGAGSGDAEMMLGIVPALLYGASLLTLVVWLLALVRALTGPRKKGQHTETAASEQGEHS
jgi:hypothetical protein